MKWIITYTGILLLAAGFGAGCSTTKRLSDQQVLYTGVKKMEIQSVTGDAIPGNVESAVKDPLSVKPNNPLYSPYVRTPFPVGLWAYNYYYTEEKSGFRYWIYKRFAKQPVLVSDVKPDQRMKLVEDILDNQGYFNSTARYEVLPQRNPKKARISYYVDVAQPWTYSDVSFPEVCCPVTRIIDSIKTSSLLRVGDRYNIDTLTAERVRIANYLRNHSYYYFRPDYLEYLADTLQEPLKVDMRMVKAQGIPAAAMQAYRFGSVDVRLYNPTGGEPDSLDYNGIKVWYQKPLQLRPKIMAGSLTIQPGEASNLSDINATLTNLTKLGVFRYVNLNVTPLDSLRGADSLNMVITAAFDPPLEAEFEADFSSKSNSFIGPGLIFGVKNKNFLRGGEHFAVRLNGSYEWQTGNTSSQVNSSSINSYEAGINLSLMFPRMLAPRFIPRSKKYESRTTLQVGASLLNRPSFFTMLSANASISYDFNSSGHSTHNLTPFKLTYNNLLRATESFDSTMQANEAIAKSFENQFIPAISYTYTYDRHFRRDRDRLIWQTTATEAGNLISGIQGLFGSGKPRKMFGSEFSQFIKGTTEIKFYRQIGKKNTLASRLLVGAGHAYGNSDVLPYSEQFYIGGANSIRAFTIRSLGPGSYRPDADDKYGYFDQTGDFKLEANVEFRFNLIGNLNGAVFLDAGNIWLLTKDPKRPGGKLTASHFFDQIALGTGAGLRFDLTYLVIRADLGVGIHLPYDTGKPGYYNIPRFRDGLGFHLAIGYPF